MKEKILDLTEGEFERDFPAALSDPDRIEKKGIEGHDIAGSIRIYTDSDRSFRGTLMSALSRRILAEGKPFLILRLIRPVSTRDRGLTVHLLS